MIVRLHFTGPLKPFCWLIGDYYDDYFVSIRDELVKIEYRLHLTYQGCIHPRRWSEWLAEERLSLAGCPALLVCYCPHLLDHANLDHDDILVAIPADDGFDVYRFDPARYLENFADEFRLGEVWYNEGDRWMAGLETKNDIRDAH